jgi:hypothetical protein
MVVLLPRSHIFAVDVRSTLKHSDRSSVNPSLLVYSGSDLAFEPIWCHQAAAYPLEHGWNLGYKSKLAKKVKILLVNSIRRFR